MFRRALTFLLMLWPALAGAVDVQGQGRLWLGPGYDSNATRDFVTAGQADGFLYGLAQLQGALRWSDRARLLGSYDVSGRKFLLLPSQDTVVQAAQLEGVLALHPTFSLGLAGRARDRRGAERDYTQLLGGLVVNFTPDPAVDVRIQISAHRFLFYQRFPYSFWGPDGSLVARYRFDRRHSIAATGSYNPRTYNSAARPPPDSTETETATRADAVLGGGISYAYRGPFQFAFSYSYYDQTSNSYGESVKRHRLNATGGLPLPGKLTFVGSLTWQPAIFPEGVYLSPELTVLEEDENVSSLTLKLIRPLTPWLELDVRYAGYLGFFPQNKFFYARHVVSLGVSVSFSK